MLMATLRVALAQINTTAGDFKGNAAKIIRRIQEAREYGARLIVFPELALCGYPPEDLLLKDAFIRQNTAWLKRIIPETKGITALVGYVKIRGSSLFNAAALLCDGTHAGSYAKKHLPNYGVFDEKRYFSPGYSYLLFNLDGVRAGITICEDIWIPGGPAQKLARDGCARLIINLSASPYHAGKCHERNEMLSVRARTNGVHIAYCNLVGGQDDLVFDGGSLILDDQGRCLFRGPLFREVLLFYDISLPQEKTGATELKKGMRVVCSSPASVSPPKKLPGVRYEIPGETGEIYEALVLGTHDYVKKNGFNRVVIGLSGGIDSALTTAIAVSSLGPDNVACVSMPSEYTSCETREDAVLVARNLKIRDFYTIPIQNIFKGFLAGLEESVGIVPPDIAEENLQARIRGTILMYFSNKFGWLVLATSNKSEASVGYTTLYGDMAGGFSPLKDVPKTLVYRLAEYINANAGWPVIPESTIKRPPTAELRPAQKDEDSLPPYSLLDPILKLYIEDDLSVREILKHGYDPSTVKKVVNMVDHAEFKRRQSPPGVKITPKAFGRDRRLPITNRFRFDENQNSLYPGYPPESAD